MSINEWDIKHKPPPSNNLVQKLYKAYRNKQKLGLGSYHLNRPFVFSAIGIWVELLFKMVSIFSSLIFYMDMLSLMFST